MPEKELTTDELIEKIRKKKAEICIVSDKYDTLEEKAEKLLENKEALEKELNPMMDELKMKIMPTKEDIQDAAINDNPDWFKPDYGITGCNNGIPKEEKK